MTPQEELFSQLFNHEKALVCDMDTLTLRAHREELAKIAFEARARLTAVDDEDNERKKKSNPKPKGFERNVNDNDIDKDAINVVKERQKRMSKLDKIQAGLVALGISTADASKLMTNGAVLARVKDAASKETLLDDKTIRSPFSQDNGFVIKPKPEEPKPLFNPFEKK